MIERNDTRQPSNIEAEFSLIGRFRINARRELKCTFERWRHLVGFAAEPLFDLNNDAFRFARIVINQNLMPPMF